MAELAATDESRTEAPPGSTLTPIVFEKLSGEVDLPALYGWQQQHAVDYGAAPTSS